MYAALASSTLIAGILAVGMATPGTDAQADPGAARTTVCVGTTHSSYLIGSDPGAGHACQSTYTPYGSASSGR